MMPWPGMASSQAATRDDDPARTILALDDKVSVERDLNSDGRAERVIYVTDRRYCGSGGCTLVVLVRNGAGWRTVSRTTVVRAPIELLPTTRHGWRDLAVTVAGGGITAPRRVRLRFDGRRYPPNPTVITEEAPDDGATVLIDR